MEQARAKVKSGDLEGIQEIIGIMMACIMSSEELRVQMVKEAGKVRAGSYFFLPYHYQLSREEDKPWWGEEYGGVTGNVEG